MAAVPPTSVAATTSATTPAGPAITSSSVANSSSSSSPLANSSTASAASSGAVVSSSSAASAIRSSSTAAVSSSNAVSSQAVSSSGLMTSTRAASSAVVTSAASSTSSTPASTSSTVISSSTTVSSTAQSSSVAVSGTSSASFSDLQATSVSSNGSSTKSLSTGAIGGIVGGIAGAILILIAAGWIWRRRKTSRYRQEHPLPPPRDSFLPAAGMSNSKSAQLGEKYNSVGEKTYDRSLSTLYVPPLPAHYPSYSQSRRQSSMSGLNQYSQQGSYTPSYDERYDGANTGPPMDFNASSGPFLGGSINGGSGSNSPAVRPQGSYGSLSGMARVDEAEGSSLPPMAFPSEFGSRPVTPSGLGSRPVTPSGLGSESGRPRPVSTSSSHRLSRIPPPSIQTANLTESGYDGSSHIPPSAYGSAPSTPNSRSRQSFGNYSSPSLGRGNSASTRNIALKMPAPLDPSTPRHGYLPSRQSSASIHGLNDFGVMNGRGYRGSRDGLSDIGLQVGGSVRHHASTASSAPSTRESGSGSGSGRNGKNESGSEPESEQNGLIMKNDKQV